MKYTYYIIILIKLTSCIDAFELDCPERSHWAIRSSSFCTEPSNYTCLRYTINHTYVEKCHKPEGISKGNKLVWQPGINNGNCSKDRYQPFNFFTTDGSDCIYQKSRCSEEGQLLVDNGNGSIDVHCRCNFGEGFVYVTKPKDVCACNPSEEDCSCYRCTQCGHDDLSKCMAVKGLDEKTETIINKSVLDDVVLLREWNAQGARIAVLCITVILVIGGIVIILYRDFFFPIHHKDNTLNNDSTMSLHPEVGGVLFKAVVELPDNTSSPENCSGDDIVEVHTIPDTDMETETAPPTDHNRGPFKGANLSEDNGVEEDIVSIHSPPNTGYEEMTTTDPGRTEPLEDTHVMKVFNGQVSTNVSPFEPESEEPIPIHSDDNFQHQASALKGVEDIQPHTQRVVPDSEVASIFKNENIDHHLQDEEEERYNNKMAALEKRHERFFESGVFFRAFDLLHECSFVTIIGASGDGKTTLAEHLALKLKQKEQYDIMIVNSSENFGKCLRTRRKQVFIVDDPFGRQHLDEQSLRSWVKTSKELKDAITNGNTKVLCTIRKPLYQLHQKRLNETMFTQNVIDLSLPEYQLLVGEKLSMLKKYIPIETQPPEDVKILQTYCPGFPMWCRVEYMKSKERHVSCTKLVNLQQTVHKAVLEIIQDLKETNPYQFCSLVLAVLNNGFFDLNYLGSFASTNTEDEIKRQKTISDITESCNVNYQTFNFRGEMINGFTALEGTFFNINKSEFKIIHDSITDAIVEFYGNLHLDIILKYSDSAFLREYVRTEKAAKLENLTACVYIKQKEHYKYFAERLQLDIENGNVSDVFLNPSISDVDFHPYFIDVITNLEERKLKELMYKQPACGDSELRHIVKYTKFALDNAKLSSTPFHWVCTLGLLDIFQTIMGKIRNKKLFLDQVPGSTTPLHFAAGYGKLEIVKELVKIGADVNVKSSLVVQSSETIGEFYSGFTPLLYAARQNHPKVVEFLLKSNADPNLVRDHGGSPMLLAADRGHTEVVKILLEHNGDPNIFCDHGTTPIILAAQDGHLETVKVLINNGADLNRQKYESKISALYGAAKNGHLECVKLLVSKGAKININGENDLTPLEIARKNNHSDVAEFLQNAMAEKQS